VDQIVILSVERRISNYGFFVETQRLWQVQRRTDPSAPLRRPLDDKLVIY